MNKVKILIVTDEENSDSALISNLNQLNCEIVNTISLNRDVISEITHTLPDLIFIETDFSKKDDLEILREITDGKIHKQIWITSNINDEKTRLYAREFNAKGVISKPFSTNEIKAIIDTYKNTNEKEQSLNSKSTVIRTILADDEELMCDLLENILIDCKCIVERKFKSGKEVIDDFKSGRVEDMTFLDIEMPEGNGLDVLKYIQENNIPTFTVIVSGHGTFKNVKVAIDSGANGFIVKPFSRIKVEQMIKKYQKLKQFN